MKLLSTTALCFMAFASVALCSCDNRPDITGTWNGMPTRINNISAASDANATMSITFINDNSEKKVDNGQLLISALIDANQPVNGENSIISAPYEVSVAATATVSGHWTFEANDDDDVIISIDPQSLQVNVDPHGVTFSSDLLTRMQKPQLDSLTAATADAWRRSISQAVKDEFYAIHKISDIKIKNGIMSCEINDRDLTFRKVSE